MQSEFNMGNILRESAEHFPDNVAVEDLAGNSLTYSELLNRSCEIQNLLCVHNLGAGTRIGLCLPKNTLHLAAMYGILMSEAAYVSLDHSAPLQRNVGICRDCELQALFIESRIIDEFTESIKESFKELRVGHEHSLLIFQNKKRVHAENLAYILYTSGSTGKPKGIMHDHKSAFTFANWAATQFEIKQTDRIASIAPFHFDLSVFDIYGAALASAALVLVDKKTSENPLALAACIANKQISVLYATPSTLSFLTAFGKMEKYNYRALHTILFAGEVFPINKLKALKSIVPEVKMFNLYGPTETNVCTWHPIPKIIPHNQTEPFPIGKSCPYAQCRIETDSEGELLVAGNSLASGYWNDKENNKAFVIDSHRKTWYHTGDLVKLNEKGEFVYINRIDRMVKRNGFRIEPGEIEKQLGHLENIQEVAVTSKSYNAQIDTVLTAHIVWQKGKEITTVELSNYCKRTLPAYLIPDNFEFHSALPKTATGKIDYSTLSKRHV